MSKVSIVLEFGSEQEAMAFLASRAAPGMQPTPVVPQAAPAQTYAPQAPQPTPAATYTPPPAMQPPAMQPVAPAPVTAQLPPGVQFLPTAPNGQPWSPTTIMQFMQQYGGSAHGVQGVQGVFKRYGFEPNVTKLDPNQLAIVASHFASMQPA